MALNRVKGTMTMNPNCEEVKAELRRGETIPHDHPDIINQVYEQKGMSFSKT